MVVDKSSQVTPSARIIAHQLENKKVSVISEHCIAV